MPFTLQHVQKEVTKEPKMYVLLHTSYVQSWDFIDFWLPKAYTSISWFLYFLYTQERRTVRKFNKYIILSLRVVRLKKNYCKIVMCKTTTYTIFFMMIVN